MKLPIFKLGIFVCAAALLVACAKDDGDEPVVPKPAEKQVEEIIKELEKLPEVSQFTEELKKMDVAHVETEELTVFAVKNSGMVSAVTKAELKPEPMKRQIAKGAYELKDLKDGLELRSINDEPLLISRVGDDVAINSIAIETQGVKVGKSIVYVVSEMIPIKASTPAKRADITLFTCNMQWTPENKAQGFPFAGVEIKVFKENKDLLDTYTTDKNGKVVFFHNESSLYYTVAVGDTLSNLDNGFRVVGVFTTQADIDSWATYRMGKPMPGYLKYADMNGDAQIDDADKLTDEKQAVGFIQYINESATAESAFYLVSKSTKWQTLFDKRMVAWDNSLKKYLIEYRKLDSEMSDGNGDAKLPVLQSNYELEILANSFWNTSYSLIRSLCESDELFAATDCPAAITAKWQASSAQMRVECALVYTLLINYFGGASYITDSKAPYTPFDNDEVIAYIEQLQQLLPTSYKYPLKALLARIYSVDKAYMKVIDLYKEIIASGQYSLLANPSSLYSSKTNKAVLLGGYDDKGTAFSKGDYFHPIHFVEIHLMQAEALLETNQNMEALELINRVLLNYKKEPMAGGATTDQLRNAAIELWATTGLNSNEGFQYANLRRWGKYLEMLSICEIEPNQKYLLLPIPMAVIQEEGSFILQNPGY